MRARAKAAAAAGALAGEGGSTRQWRRRKRPPADERGPARCTRTGSFRLRQDSTCDVFRRCVSGVFFGLRKRRRFYRFRRRAARHVRQGRQLREDIYAR